MKYCPFCGATLLGSAASFCAECGKQVQNGSKVEPKDSTEVLCAASAGTKTARKPPIKRSAKQATSPRTEISSPSDGYDGYYDDVPTLDNGHEREPLDPETIKKIVMIIGGALLVISLAVLAMQLL